MDNSDLENLDYSYEVLANYEKYELIEIIKLLRKKNDELKNIQRNSEGEIIVIDDKIVNDEEEIIS